MLEEPLKRSLQKEPKLINLPLPIKIKTSKISSDHYDSKRIGLTKILPKFINK